MRKSWSDAENEAIVEDYFNMLQLELKRKNFVKKAHREALRERLNGRSDGSVERKHMNISHILVLKGIPYIDGYKPMKHVQTSLSEAVSNYLQTHREIHKLILESADVVPPLPSITDWRRHRVEPPKYSPDYKTGNEMSVPHISTEDYLEREANNQKLGDAGEEFIINYERERLKYLGKESLADRIEHVAVTEGPSAGFDILSFEESGKDRYIEAKTTKYGCSTPFYVTRNELKFSRDNSPKYFLYRLFKFGDKPKLYLLHGDLSTRCKLEPSVYVARSV